MDTTNGSRKRLERLRAAARRAGHRLRHEDDGYTTETIVVTALLVLLAIAVIAIIAAKVTGKANSIDLGLAAQPVLHAARTAGAAAARW